MYEVQATVLSGYVSLSPVDASGVGSGPCVVAFTGCDLKEDQLKDWLRSCAKQVVCRTRTWIYHFRANDTILQRTS